MVVSQSACCCVDSTRGADVAALDVGINQGKSTIIYFLPRLSGIDPESSFCPSRKISRLANVPAYSKMSMKRQKQQLHNSSYQSIEV